MYFYWNDLFWIAAASLVGTLIALFVFAYLATRGEVSKLLAKAADKIRSRMTPVIPEPVNPPTDPTTPT